MSCDQTEHLSLLMDGELPPADAERVERHAASCAACGAALDEMRALRRLVSAMKGSSIGQMPDEAMARLRLHVQGLVESADIGLIWMARVFSGVAASVLIAGLWLLNQPTDRPSPQSAGAWERAAITLSIDPAPVATAPDLRSPESVLDDLTGTNLSAVSRMEAELP